jgi:hypothetical protein
MSKKRAGKKSVYEVLARDENWCVKAGSINRLTPGKVRKGNLFKFVGEKIPFFAVKAVEKYVRDTLGDTPNGVYLAIDSMGCPRYVGRGRVFQRLQAHQKHFPVELQFFSFYIVKEKQHEREIETLLIRATSFLSVLNERKVRTSIEAGRILDYEVGTQFVVRQRKKGRKSGQSSETIQT